MAPRPAVSRKRASNTLGSFFFLLWATLFALALGRAAINGRLHCSGPASFVTVTAAALQPRLAQPQTLPPQPQPSSLERRRAANGALLSILGASAPLTVETPLVARAESTKVGYQVQLPRVWSAYQQRGNPGLGDKSSKILFAAGNGAEKIEAKVVRVPLAVNRADPQGLGSLALIEYFSTPSGQQPRITKDQVMDLLSKGVAADPKNFRFNLTGTPTEFFRNTTKYLRYDYEVETCPADIVEGAGGERKCDYLGGLDSALAARRHSIINTVVAEPVNGAQVADGILESDLGAEVLWVADVSLPATKWADNEKQVNQFLATFSVGTEAQLAAVREQNATRA